MSPQMSQLDSIKRSHDNLHSALLVLTVLGGGRGRARGQLLLVDMLHEHDSQLEV